MPQAVNRRHRRHRVFENLIPLAEDQIRTQQHTAPFIPLRQQGEKHFHLLATLLQISDVIQDQHIISIQFFELLL